MQKRKGKVNILLCCVLRELKLSCTIIAISKTKNQEIVVAQMSYLEIWRKALKHLK